MQIKDLTALMERSFDHHIDGLEVAARTHGVTIIQSDKLRNTDTVFMVSPAAYAELMKRATPTQKEPKT